MLAGALSAFFLVAAIAFAGGHIAFGEPDGSQGGSPCRNGLCRQSRCVRARDISRDHGNRSVSPPCPPVRTGGPEDEHTRPQARWRFVPRPM